MGLFSRHKPGTAMRVFDVRDYETREQRDARVRPSLTAAGFRVKKRDGDNMRRLIQPWQARAYAYYDIIPEIKYAAQFYSRALSVLRLYAAKKGADGEYEEIEDQNDPGVIALERIQDPGGGRSGLLSSYGRLQFLGGEAYLLVSVDQDTGDEQWEMLSPDELRVMTGSQGPLMTRFKAPSLAADSYSSPPDDAYEPLEDDQAVVYRLWRRHPRYSMLADSTMQGVLDICEELALLTQTVRARARSRLAGNGILLINGKVTVVPLSGDTADENPDEDPFVSRFVEATTLPIVDEGTASAVVPLVVRVDSDDLGNVMKHIQITDPMQLYPETGLRKEAIDRLAIGLDMPPEVLTGIADANHWSGWQVDEQTWKGHLQPVAQGMVDDLTAAFFRPSLRDEGVADWRDYAIRYDATAVINHPDRSKDAKDLYDRRALSKQALRDAGGFTEDDAPSENELWEMIGVATRDGSLALFGIPSVKAGGIEPEAGELVSKDGTTTGTSSAEATKGTPEKPDAPAEPVVGGGNGHDALAAKIVGACDLALHRARELAGARLRTLANRDKEAKALLEGVRNGQVAFTLGRDRAKALRAPSDRDLVAGARDLISETLQLWQLDPTVAEPLGERLEQHAARTLFEERPSPLPPSFSNYVRGLEVGA